MNLKNLNFDPFSLVGKNIEEAMGRCWDNGWTAIRKTQLIEPNIVFYEKDEKVVGVRTNEEVVIKEKYE